MIGRRLVVAALTLLASCQEDCRCNCAGGGDVAINPRAVAGERLTLRGGDKDAIELDLTRAELRVGHVAIRAAGPRSAWVHALAIDDAIQDEGGRLSLPEGGRCTVRYLDGGRVSEADFTIRRADVRPLSQRPDRLRAQLALRCRKSFSQTTAGTPYAASLPEQIEIVGIVTLLRRD